MQRDGRSRPELEFKTQLSSAQDILLCIRDQCTTQLVTVKEKPGYFPVNYYLYFWENPL
jgi:hypothetical protein